MGSTPWLDAREMAAWRAFVETVHDLNAALESDLAAHDLTMGDYQVLVYLSDVDDHAMRMCDLATRLQLSPSGLTRRLDGLVRSGLVERRKLEAAAPTHVRSVRRHVIDRMSKADLAAMTRIFRSIRSGLDSEDAARARVAS
jgi:DNA-binding MarR family transcriptional regulator